MRLLVSASFGVVTLALCGCVLGPAKSAPGGSTEARPVMTWVAPYAVAKSKARLQESFGGLGMKDGLSDLALQFWEPSADGAGLHRVERGDDTSDAAVSSLRDWGRAHGVRVLLCVYNFNANSNAWDWPWARSAFVSHPKEFTKSLLDEMQRLELDGIDLDLEGVGTLEGDKQAYVAFVRELSARLRPLGKRLTLDSFAYVWNAPNQGWWPALFPLVDAINSMGYEEIGASAGLAAEAWRGFAAQEDAAGSNMNKLLLGMPSYKDEWRGKVALEHLRWVAERGHSGISLWDSQLDGEAWRTHEAWSLITALSGRGSGRH